MEFNKQASPGIIQAIIPLIFLITLLTLNVIYFGDQTLDGANQIALMLAASIAGLIAVQLGKSWASIRGHIVKSIGSAMPSMLILLLIGSLAGTWMLSGVVPAMIYYGLNIFHPTIFLFATVVISGIVSVATGSSWSTIATIGIALIGIGKTLGISEGIIAGAIISGAYFGDKMSPLSDTTNLASAMAGTNIFKHIRYMSITTTPSIVITLIIFLIIGFTYDFSSSHISVSEVQTILESKYNMTPWLFIVPGVLIIIIIKKVPPLPALLVGALLGAIFAVLFQPHLVREVSGIDGSYFEEAYVSVFRSLFGKVSITTENSMVNELLTSSGMAGMLNTIWLIIAAMVFGGAMESAGLLQKITSVIIRFAHSTGSLIASTIASSIFFNITASDQYISIVVPGKMFAETYKKRRLKPEVLSRTLEDGGTITSVLVPWNTCGATQSRVLGVPTIDYLPYAFFNIINPFVAIVIAGFNYKIRYYKEGEEIPEEGFDEDERKDI
jgi:Na+:H+ antiporter, NhaC family